MLAQDSSVVFGVSGSSDSGELDGFRELLVQVEAELQRSEVYRRAIETLEQTAPEGTAAQFLLKAVGREAIRLALRQLQREAEPQPEPEQSSAIDLQFSEDVTELPVVLPTTRRSKKSRQLEQDQQAEEHRQNCLRRMGAQIRAARQARSMSFDELHSKTLVPVHQLQAIEVGQGAHFPEDIYLRGFVRRIAKALDLDAAKLLDMLPAPDPVKSVVPSWYRPPQKNAIAIGNFALQPVHLYVGYAALIAGGFAWVSHQTAPTASPNALNLDSQQISPSSKSQTNSASQVRAGAIAPPERL